ncbi:1360_t:CDS:2, partial [Cetraspora pellucida]
CMCHILNLIVKEGLKEISILYKKVHKIMKFLAYPLASDRLEILESHCRISGIRFLKPILEIDTQPSMPTCLDNESLTVLKSFHQLLKPFEIATSLDHLKATLIEVSGYNDHDAEMVVNDICKKLITYGAKYSSTSSSNYVE